MIYSKMFSLPKLPSPPPTFSRLREQRQRRLRRARNELFERAKADLEWLERSTEENSASQSEQDSGTPISFLLEQVDKK